MYFAGCVKRRAILIWRCCRLSHIQ